jgi:hypothetical protein
LTINNNLLLFINITQTMKKKHYLLKFLAVTFGISEIFIGIGVISTFFIFPYAARIVEERTGNLGIFVTNGTPGFIFTRNRGGGFSWISVEQDQTPALRPRGAPVFTATPRVGRVTFGRFRTNETARQLKMANNTGTSAVIDSLEGSFTFDVANSTDATAILAPIKWPFILSFSCTGLTTIAILELLSRMFRKVAAGEVFTRTSIKYAQAIGLLFIGSSLLKGLSAGWLKHAMASVVMQQVATSANYLDSSARGDTSGFITGLVILSLAEIFRQGLNLKEDTALTI